MSEQRNLDIQRLFAQAEHRPVDEKFTAAVMSEADSLRRRKIARRVLTGLAVSAVSFPLQDVALDFAQVMMTSLIELDNTLAAQLLAPINSVGGVVSALLLGLRIVYRRIFVRC